MLMEEGRSAEPAKETMSTADQDNAGILQLQSHTMRQQDAELEELERSVTSTKVWQVTIALHLTLDADFNSTTILFKQQLVRRIVLV